MKSSEEMVNSLFARRDRYLTEKTAKRKRALRIAASTGACCLVVLLAGVVWRSGLLASPSGQTARPTGSSVPRDETGNTQENERSATEAVGQATTEATGTPVSDRAVLWAENDVSQAYDGVVQWNGLTVSLRLRDALEAAAPDDVLAILAKPPFAADFEYQGRTLAEYYAEYCAEKDRPELLLQLLKEGEALKYGTLLYEEGAPNGEKWDRELYEERVRLYGAELLETYIVDGQFLAEKLERDLAAARQENRAARAYEQAKNARYEALAASMQGELPSQPAPKQYGVIVFLSRGAFSAFSPEEYEGWAFDLAAREEAADDVTEAHSSENGRKGPLAS